MKLRSPHWPQRLPTSWVVAGATLGPLGRKLPAPGTWGSLAGLLYFLVAFLPLELGTTLGLALVGLYVAVGICGEGAERMGRKDPGEIILDEFMAMPLCFLGWRELAAQGWPSAVIFLTGFALFRFFDIVKPLGIRRLQAWPAGWGIVVDDAVAALATCATLHVGAWLWTLH